MNIKRLNDGIDTMHAWAVLRFPGETWQFAHALGTGVRYVIQPFLPTKGLIELKTLPDFPDSFTSPLPQDLPPETPTQTEHLNRVNQAVDNMRGSLQKVVLSRTKHVSFHHALGLGDVLESLDQHYPKAYVFAVHLPGQAVWIGASPERLLKVENQRGQTMALAGTRISASLSSHPWTAKEKTEQQLVTDFIRGRLEKAGVTELNMKGPKDQNAGHLTHLCTTFEFDWKADALPLALTLHPTPAVAGLPRNGALDWIATHETHDRGLYAGFIGKIGNKAPTELLVMLRCMQFTPSAALLYLGGGLTPDSNPQEEWNETEAKAQTLLSVLVKC